MTKDWILARNPYQIKNWIKPPYPDNNTYDGIVIGPRKHFWNKKIYLNITSRSLTVERKANLYYGATIYLEDKYRWPLFFMLKEMVKDFPVIIYGKDKTYTYLKQASKEKLLLELLHLDKKVPENA